ERAARPLIIIIIIIIVVVVVIIVVVNEHTEVQLRDRDEADGGPDVTRRGIAPGAVSACRGETSR
ncbi:MAG: hypothetical protein M0Z82_04065, partial [Actinomycetota bacterium]|nr:hypothetical protein [Actinomycetota bacterium]